MVNLVQCPNNCGLTTETDMSAWKPALALLLVFFAGIVVGVVGTRVVVRRVVQDYLNNPASARVVVGNQVFKRLVQELQLGPVQRPRVREVLSEMQGQLKLIRDETQPRRAQVFSNAEDQINLILRPAQREKFQTLIQENRALNGAPNAIPF